MKKTLSLLIAFILCIGIIPITASAVTISGDGSSDNPYQITNYSDLLEFASIVNAGDNDACAILMNDIIVSAGSKDFTPIIGSGPEPMYEGVFDGNNKTISGLIPKAFNDSTRMVCAMFYHIGTKGQVRSLTLSDIQVDGDLSAAIAKDSRGLILQCAIKSGTIKGECCSGILLDNLGLIEECVVLEDVSFIGEFVAGIALSNYSCANIAACVNEASITSDMSAGICVDNSGIINDCINFGEIIKGSGICYETIKDTITPIITNCINVGKVYVGPILGDARVGGVDVTNCYYNSNTSGCTDTYGSAKTTAQLTGNGILFSLFLNSTAWTERENDYPLPGHIYNILKKISKASKNVSVNYSVSPSYTVTIPSQVTLGKDMKISVENVLLEKGKALHIKITETSDTNNGFKLTTATGAELTYTVKIGSETVSVGKSFFMYDPDAPTSDNVTLTFVAPTSAPKYAGEYIGTVSFGISVQ